MRKKQLLLPSISDIVLLLVLVKIVTILGKIQNYIIIQTSQINN